VTSVDQSQEKGPYRIDLAIEETGIGQIDIAISLLNVRRLGSSVFARC
jgi:hypothetical protein